MVSAKRGGVAIDRETWRRLLGDRVARRTEPGPLVAGILTVYVASAPWAQELSLLSNELLQRLQPLGLRIGAVRFRVRQRITGPTPNVKQRPAARAALPNELRERVQAVDDPELRDVISNTLELWLGRDAKLNAKSTAPAPRSAAGRSGPSARSSTPRSSAFRDKPETPKSRRR